MRIVIVEDEKPAADKLEMFIKEYDSDAEIIYRITSVQNGISWFNNNPPPDVAFFDIHLGDGHSFEIFEGSEVNCPVIFTTAYEQYAIKAFKVNSIDYLLKPIDKNELFAALKKYIKLSRNIKDNKPDNKLILNSLLETMKKNYKNRFLIKAGEHIRSVSIDQIECFYSLNKSNYLMSSNNRSYYIDYSLDQIEEMLDPELFFRVSRKFIINLNHIKDIISYSNSRLKVKLNNDPGEEIIVSRDKVKSFKNWLDK